MYDKYCKLKLKQSHTVKIENKNHQIINKKDIYNYVYEM